MVHSATHSSIFLNGNAVAASDINHFAFHHHVAKSSPFKDISVNPNMKHVHILLFFAL